MSKLPPVKSAAGLLEIWDDVQKTLHSIKKSYQ